MKPTRSTYLFALAVLTSSMVWTSEAFAQQKLGYPPGRGSYVRYCGSCHRVRSDGFGLTEAALGPFPFPSCNSAREKEWWHVSDRAGDQNP
jgi:hypothetical protein